MDPRGSHINASLTLVDEISFPLYAWIIFGCIAQICPSMYPCGRAKAGREIKQHIPPWYTKESASVTTQMRLNKSETEEKRRIWTGGGKREEGAQPQPMGCMEENQLMWAGFMISWCRWVALALTRYSQTEAGRHNVGREKVEKVRNRCRLRKVNKIYKTYHWEIGLNWKMNADDIWHETYCFHVTWPCKCDNMTIVAPPRNSKKMH